MTTIKNIAAAGLLLSALSIPAQAADLLVNKTTPISHQEKLRGSITPERSWWDLKHYDLYVDVQPDKRYISGTNVMTYKVLSNKDRLQIELQPPMKLGKVTQNGKQLKVDKDGYTYFIHTVGKQEIGKEYQVTIEFNGQPQVAKRPPWDGGIQWEKDANGNHFIATSNQGNGASIWWPNKDHPYDEPDNGADVSVEVPENLMDISNGRLVGIDENAARNTKTYHWRVTNTINNYAISLNIGDYVHFSEKYKGEKGVLDMDYYVLRDNLAKAKVQFKDATRTMEALEYWFGPYPFYEDSFKLIEVPYLGMEHQSAVTYGNGYQNGYLGRDRSRTGWGLKFDFIIVHESGHEWFANNLTNKDVADMWIHESFTTYSENLFVEYFYGKEAGNEYMRGQRANIANQSPIIGTYNADRSGSSDMYDKGANMLHTIRQIVDNDKLWREILRGLNKDFYHQIVTTEQIEKYLSEKSGKDLSSIFDQYLRDYRLPTLEYLIKDKKMMVRWSNSVKNFAMPIKVTIDGKERWITPTTRWASVKIDKANPSFSVDKNFYISTLNVLGE
ncbi:MAG: M1 family metallopeptidase [Psychrobium sp.]